MTAPKTKIVPVDEEINQSGEYYDHPLLIEEPPLQVLPALAEAIGLEESIVIQQLHYMLRNPKNGKIYAGERWIFNTYEQWEKIFPFWSDRTIRRIFMHLEEMHLVISCQPEAGISRRKYYRMDTAMVNRLRKGTLLRPKNHAAKLAASSGQVGRFERPDVALPSTKSTLKESEGSKESEETPSSDGALSYPEIPAVWMPKGGTKAQKLASLPIPKFPTENEFDSFLQEAGCISIIDGRPDLYLDLCDRKWHHWRENSRKWVPIRNWREYVKALEETISAAKSP